MSIVAFSPFPLSDDDDGLRADAGVTELVLSHGCPRQRGLLLPMLAYLSRQADNRWITWIAPSGIDRHTLESHGVDTGVIRLIHTGEAGRIFRITREALASGSSHTVISSPGKLTENAYARLEHAARQGGTQGLLLRMR